jgi:hypothetical protein
LIRIQEFKFSKFSSFQVFKVFKFSSFGEGSKPCHGAVLGRERAGQEGHTGSTGKCLGALQRLPAPFNRAKFSVLLARTFSVEAIECLGESIRSQDERVRVVAAQALLDRAYGKPLHCLLRFSRNHQGTTRGKFRVIPVNDHIPQTGDTALHWI